MTTKLVLFNAALRHIGERKLVALTDAVEPRYALDDAYTTLIDELLVQGFWKFAIRVSQITYSPSVTTTFGYPNAFAKPSDFIRTHKFCTDEYLTSALTDYTEEAGYWYANETDAYLSYVSNDASYGASLTSWTPAFNKFAEWYLASQIVNRLAPAVDSNKVLAMANTLREDALAKDAMEGPTEFLPRGGWRLSRGRSSRRDRGSRTNLTG